jgi:hypothetical protein
MDWGDLPKTVRDKLEESIREAAYDSVGEALIREMLEGIAQYTEDVPRFLRYANAQFSHIGALVDAMDSEGILKPENW